MVMLTLWIVTQSAFWPDNGVVAQEGKVVRAEGVLNTYYEEFSALDFA